MFYSQSTYQFVWLIMWWDVWKTEFGLILKHGDEFFAPFSCFIKNVAVCSYFTFS